MMCCQACASTFAAEYVVRGDQCPACGARGQLTDGLTLEKIIKALDGIVGDTLHVASDRAATWLFSQVLPDGLSAAGAKLRFRQANDLRAAIVAGGPVTETSDPVVAAGWFGRTVDVACPSEIDPSLGEIIAVYANGVEVHGKDKDFGIEWPIRLVEVSHEGK